MSFCFPSAEVELIQRQWNYDEASLVADIGGYSGLFLGWSLFSVIDFFTGLFVKKL